MRHSEVVSGSIAWLALPNHTVQRIEILGKLRTREESCVRDARGHSFWVASSLLAKTPSKALAISDSMFGNA